MLEPGNHPLTLRVNVALVLANLRYWSTVAALVHTQLDHWTQRTEDIPDHALQKIAITNLREEGFNAQATATLATLARRPYRTPVVEAIVGLQVLYDYLDSLIERPLADPLAEGRQLYQAFIDAIVLDNPSHGDYYPQTQGSDDGGYLQELVDVVRNALIRLPSQTAIAQVSAKVVRRCSEAQIHAHAASSLGDRQLERWASSNALGTGLEWREFLAGAVSSGLSLHALIALAGDPNTSQGHAFAIDEVYLSICAATTLLDGLIDYEQDIFSMGRPGYTRYYEDGNALTQGLRSVIHRAASNACDLPNGPYHLMILIGVVAYYLSAPTASSDYARYATEQIRQELTPLITPILAIMRVWRSAKRTRTAFASVDR